MDPISVLAACAAIIGALVVFATLVLLGVQAVRVLRLPQDLPPDLHFAPPPPPSRREADASAAQAVAARQAKLAELHGKAFSAARLAEACRELSSLAGSGQPGTPAARIAQAATRAKSAAEAADRARALPPEQAEPELETQLRAAVAAHTDAEAAARELPPRSEKRLYLLIALAALMMLWLVALVLLRHHDAGPVTGAG
jgi:hypothetical protein